MITRPLAAASFGATILMVGASGAGAVPVLHAPAGGTFIHPAAYGDLPTSGGRHRGGRKSRGQIAHTPEPALPDLHGATREGADKEYRKKYGF